MTIYEHITEFAGLPVVDWEPDSGEPITSDRLYRLRVDYDEATQGIHWTDMFDRFLAAPNSGATAGIVIGTWDTMTEGESSARVVEAIASAYERLPNLRAIFLGDIISEENEISWITQSDVSPLFEAYPQLEHFCVRGGQDLSLGTLHHDRLKTLVVQTGGLSREVVGEVASANLPALEHLELWFGSENYGGDATVEDITPLLDGTRFPRLVYLGLRDSEIADAIAAAVVQSPLLERVRVLDLSLGTLGDTGAAALLAGPAVARLEKLDIHHHYCSQEMVDRLQALGITVDASDPQEEEEYDGERWRYVAVSE